MDPDAERPTRLSACPIERIRVPLERSSIAPIVTAAPITALRAWLRRNFGVGGDDLRAARGRMARLREETSPRVFAILREVLHVLRVEAPVELFLLPADEMPEEINNGAAGWDGATIQIMLTRGAARGADHAALRALLGHELGHALAHRPRFRSNAGGWLPDEARPARDAEEALLDALASMYSQAAELTADRFELLACQDVRVVARMNLEPACRYGPLVESDADAFLARCIDRGERARARGARSRGYTHPKMTLRTYASWLFSRSDLYRELTGRGPGSEPIAQINDALAALVDTSVAVDRDALGTPIEPAQVAREAGDILASAVGDVGEIARAAAHDVAAADLLGALRAAARALAAPATDEPAARRSDEAAPAADEPARAADPETVALLARFEALERRAKLPR